MIGKASFKKLVHGIGKISLFHMDILLLIGILIICNIGLPRGNLSHSLIFIPSAFKHGQWWRLFTHPFVHVNIYHLVLDAGAFLLLYKALDDRNPLRRIIYLVACGTSSLVVALIVSPLVYTQGLCGLSGIAHGLMAVTGLEMMRSRKDFRAGGIIFLLVVLKGIYELLTGNVLFLFMHMGFCGSPIASCHAGGVLGGIAAFFLLRVPCSFGKRQESGWRRGVPPVGMPPRWQARTVFR